MSTDMYDLVSGGGVGPACCFHVVLRDHFAAGKSYVGILRLSQRSFVTLVSLLTLSETQTSFLQ